MQVSTTLQVIDFDCYWWLEFPVAAIVLRTMLNATFERVCKIQDLI